MKSGLITAFVALICLLAPVQALAKLPQADVDAQMLPGLAAGTAAPDISVLTPEGEPADFASLSGEKGLVLVFVRSVRWCPFCRKQLLALNEISDDVRAAGYGLVALSYDAPSDLAKFKAKRKMTYEFVSDPGSTAIRAFGLLNADHKPDSKAYGVPHPAIYLIGADQQIKGRLMEEGFKKRPPASAVLDMVSMDPMPVSAVQINND